MALYDHAAAEELVLSMELEATSRDTIMESLTTLDVIAKGLAPETKPAETLRDIAAARMLIDGICYSITPGPLVQSLRRVLEKNLPALERRCRAAADPERELELAQRTARLRQSQADNFAVSVPTPEPGAPPVSCFISYAWPTEANFAKENWVRGFLVVLRTHLRGAGVRALLDTEDCGPGENMVRFMNQCQSTTHVLVIGTESLLDKHNEAKHNNVQTELALLTQRRDLEARCGASASVTRIHPLLLSGTAETALPPVFRRLGVIDARDYDYPALYRKLLEIFGAGWKTNAVAMDS